MRRHVDFKNYQIRVIEPEALNSLGNFWQALDNKPRAIINFAVTLPVSIVHPNETATGGAPILETIMQSTQQSGAVLEKLEQLLLDRLLAMLGNTSLAKESLMKVKINVAPLPAGDDESVQKMQVIISGVTHWATDVKTMEVEIADWYGEELTIDGQPLVLQEVINELTSVVQTP